ncbi:phytoene/squalene synthase family protein [Vibrio sp. B181a]|uniref:phytoene/squalene synthase family protein n=1 Tax=Vibrio sp. B181a TaxID=2835906 RepID=UPI0025559FB5|nr:phytoene/squalene synthase family protein [Vibrio sp. B181a]MDK9771747.1 phytoene/squalene synthase family protein [Vibrio sp. B181a]
MENTALKCLSNHGKTWRFASFLLSKQQVEQAARLYYFCRCIDDIADSTANKQLAFESLEEVQRQLSLGKSDEPFVDDFLQLSSQLDIPVMHAFTLVRGVQSDIDSVLIQSECELIQYAYRVAGVVGLMMCPILKADNKGMPYAIDLGIALQLTNIARDVLEDAEMGRRYLPYQWCPIAPEDIASDERESVRTTVSDAIVRLLTLADQYYSSARQGYRFLPPPSRRAIIVAESVYRQIGVKLRKRGLQYWKGRTVVTPSSKVAVAMSALSTSALEATEGHDICLHQPLVLLSEYKKFRSEFDGNTQS